MSEKEKNELKRIANEWKVRAEQEKKLSDGIIEVAWAYEGCVDDLERLINVTNAT